MSRFQPITLGWNGKSYVIPPNKVMGAIARVEDFVTVMELQGYTQRETLPLSKIARAFASLLTYAGAADADAEEIYASMFGTVDAQQEAIKAVTVLLMMMIPPKDMIVNGADGAPGKLPPAAAKSSKKRIRRP